VVGVVLVIKTSSSKIEVPVISRVTAEIHPAFTAQKLDAGPEQKRV
jgi:hypothetical protein